MTVIDEYFCWLEGLDEDDAKAVKTDSVKEAARIAVDAWRHEGTLDMNLADIIVNVRDPNNQVHKIHVNMDRFIDASGPNV